MKGSPVPVVKDLVLVGGGHSHVAVLKRFGMRPVPGLRLTLITRDVHTPYSGMLPGYIAGHYAYDECHIDLRPLAQFAGARLYHTEVVGLDLAQRQVLCRDRPPVRYDLLSLNTGSRPSTVEVPGAAELSLPVKPIDRFLRGWKALVERVAAGGQGLRIAVVGGGAGGVELCLAARHRLRSTLAAAGRDPDALVLHVITDTTEILPTHNARVRRKFMDTLTRRGVSVHRDHRAQKVELGAVICEGGKRIAADAVLWVTQAAPAPWIAASGLATDAAGFVRVNACLQSTSHGEVFAAGDIAAMAEHPRPKSGVFAVRQGPPLARNLRRAALGRPLKPYRPQRQFLSLISTGDKYAVASRSFWSVEGRWVWRLKDWIDRRFMEGYNDLPEMGDESAPQIAPGLAGAEALKEISALAMRCGGCGAKVGSTVLSRVVGRLDPVTRDEVLVGLQAPDDAAVIAVPPGKLAVQTVDYFRAFLDDPYLFGQIAAHHSLGDIFAMGAEPQSALAIATVPFGKEEKVEATLYDMMAGAVAVLNASNTALVGGHSSEGAELAFGLAVTGLASPESILRKGGMCPGDALLLTKALGTGTLFAADMRRKAKGRWIDGALASMLLSNQAAAACLQRHGATACTDVTGFGLLGHLVEMTRASDVDVALQLDELPILEGARDTLALGIFSSLQPQNLRLRRAVRNLDQAARHPSYPLLFDPQTAGGLLASVPAAQAASCATELRALGYGASTVIGTVEARSEALESVTLVWEDRVE